MSSWNDDSEDKIFMLEVALAKAKKTSFSLREIQLLTFAMNRSVGVDKVYYGGPDYSEYVCSECGANMNMDDPLSKHLSDEEIISIGIPIERKNNCLSQFAHDNDFSPFIKHNAGCCLEEMMALLNKLTTLSEQ